jgi:hypothetical protein
MSGTATLPQRQALNLHAGDWVIVRSQEEILATLDERGRLDDLPFQPEMLEFCNRRMRVAKVAHKTCDNIHKTGGRDMKAAVHLENSRCNGALHGGCQADCVFFWKEAWLRRDADPKPLPVPGAPEPVCSEEAVKKWAQAPSQGPSADPIWICQTTSLYDATTLLPWWDIRQYVKDVTSGNHSAWHMAKIMTAAAYRNLANLGIGYGILVRLYNLFQKAWGGKPFPIAEGKIPNGQPTPEEHLGLQVGELVEVKSGEEIMATLNAKGLNRGMRYDLEMLKYSGGRYKVEMLVHRLINESTGKMLNFKSPCIQLETVYCRAECTPLRLGCPRASNTYWHEIWLRRVPGK